MTQAGRAYELPISGRLTVGSESSSSPLAALLPTPAAGNFNDSEDPASWEARRQRNLAKGINGNGQGTPLGMAVKMLPTPTAKDADSSANRTAGRKVPNTHKGETLTDMTRLLPTPRASDRYGPGDHGDGGPDLRTAVQLLPTPTTSDAKGPSPNHGGTTAEAVASLMLPTPTARDYKGAWSTTDGVDLCHAVRDLTGGPTPPPSNDGNAPSDDQRPTQLTLQVG